MVFNSLVFGVFIIIVLPVVLLLNRYPRARNGFILVASYFFYGWWDWRFLGLFILTTLVDYSCSLGMMLADGQEGGELRRKILMRISIISNLSILGFFKYWGFFVESAKEFLTSINLDVDLPVLRVVLPVGISFYTFQTMSYTIDVYRRAIPAERNLITFAAYLSFFPQLVAGPIERASHLIPQFKVSRSLSLEAFYQGVFQIGWGLFKKVVIADNVSGVADVLFASESPGGLDVILGVIAFSIQVYADFSGYSDIACGLARCMGFDLMANFRQPFFATNPSDFWRRWHISLSTWLRDYLYIPLGGNRSGNTRTNLNLMITMILGGLWHGAAWTFVAWGTYHGLLLVAHRI
ncbi:MAG: MBOAT family protein, partial [Planctomyces sp.]|nr:MBOAT family protein [Planctomyces sp.]